MCRIYFFGRKRKLSKTCSRLKTTPEYFLTRGVNLPIILGKYEKILLYENIQFCAEELPDMIGNRNAQIFNPSR